jgi:hypothetical protein
VACADRKPERSVGTLACKVGMLSISMSYLLFK